ncbi:MAG: [NiFe]-hydrogenase assembly chaperone HybE, partial [Cellvibrionaceae bacterium]|nr:[NiFe]-hydrogenase assembly chaperone HybE [Cellvibrionaceae bacterium]
MTEQDWLQNKVQQLENCYREVLRTSMAGMPLINPKLKIEAVDFGLLEGSMVGVLISPWFMNLMLLPGPDQDWAEQTELGKYKHSFASGQYQFIAGHKANI